MSRADGIPERRITINGQPYLLRLEPAGDGGAERIAAWRDGSEVHRLDLAEFLRVDTAGNTNRAQAIKDAFAEMEKQLLTLKP
jgi:hypothetical protein